LSLKYLVTVAALFVACLLGASPASAAITVTEKLAEAQTSDNDASWTSAGTFSIANNALGVCFVSSTALAANLATPTLTGGSMTTWTEITNVSFDTIATPTSRMTAFRGLGSGAGAAAVTAAFSANQTSVNFNCWEFTNPDLGGTNGSGAIAQSKTASGDSTATNCQTTFDNALGSTQVVMETVVTGGSKTFTAEFASVGTELSNTAPVTELKAQYLANGSDSTPNWSWTGGIANGCIGVEVKEAAGAGGGPPAGSLMMMGVGR
jgi:hypothetical protein